MPETAAPTRSRVVRNLASLVSLAAAVAAVTLAVHVAFVVFEANPQNGLVELVDDLADRLVLWFDDLFTPENVKQRVTVNYGLAAVFYLLAGRFAAGLIRRAD